MPEWKEAYKPQGKNNMGSFTFKSCNELVGNEIFIDLNSDILYVSMYVFPQ